ncbi:MAG: argininosuccinate lyase [Deltaproteobacteria bacterium]|nr:argininosuccinate lyase [Deltaproteobacteria bacterium]MBW2632849.1 argininosuccinate lyase [Deltaproteobacteria bacterium]MBW2677051.1 argininosuccinate lyase [Deltaproteobacteria bacterium]
MPEKPWDGRFSEKTHRIVETFTASIDVDKRLYAYDIEGSIAHLKTLEKAGIISEDETSTLIQGLVVIKREIDRGRFEFDESLEDIHMHIEARLLQEVGKVAQKLHTARSRNDQVALDVRMYLRDNVTLLVEHLDGLRDVLVGLAKANIDVVMPGYTHLQPAQPVLFAHHIMAYYEMFKRDGQRLAGCLDRINVMPLGSAALAGTTYPIDRHFTAELLDFPEVSANSMDSVADRDFIMEFLADASICMVHFSRLSEELILWSSAEFGFIEIPDAFATGSSIMPQKKNPDVPELVRGKTGAVFGDLMSMLTLMKSLPMAYNRDMQEDKPPLFRAVDTLTACVDVYTAMLPRLTIKRETMQAAASRGYLNATDMADYLVAQGMPFRKAHECVGKTVGYALKKGKELHELTLAELQTFSSLVKEDIFDFLSIEQVINRRRSFGGTASENVAAAIKTAEAELKG